MNTWHTRLTHAREARGLEKAEFARRVGVSAPTVTDWESGKIRKLEAGNMLNICAVLSIRPEWLLRGKGSMDPGRDPAGEPQGAATQGCDEVPQEVRTLEVDTRQLPWPLRGDVEEAVRAASAGDISWEDVRVAFAAALAAARAVRKR